MANKQDYLSALRVAIWNMHQCSAVWERTEHVHESFSGKTVWDGDVEIFTAMQHPKAKRVYAWAHLDGPKDQKSRFVTVLELPPVKDARTAVQASIMADSKTGQS